MKQIKEEIVKFEDRKKIAYVTIALDDKGRGNNLIKLYFFIKILNLVASIVNLLILYFLLGTVDFVSIGKNVMTKIWHDGDWSLLENFPRSALCEFFYLNDKKPYNVSLQYVHILNNLKNNVARNFFLTFIYNQYL